MLEARAAAANYAKTEINLFREIASGALIGNDAFDFARSFGGQCNRHDKISLCVKEFL